MKKLLSLFLIAVLFAACSNNQTGNTAANEQAAKNEASVKEFYEKVINGHNPDLMDQYCAADFTDHQPAPNHTGKGLDDSKASFKEWFAMMPDVKGEIQDVTSKGNQVWIKYRMTGTNSGSMPDMPATNKSMDIEGVEIIAFNNEGKATDRWGYAEEMKMAQQLGWMPPMGSNQMAAHEGEMEKTGKEMDKAMEKVGVEKKNN